MNTQSQTLRDCLGVLNPSYTFDTFLVGNSNLFAHVAALAVADNQPRPFNPLLIYGASGTGKTHLLHAIGHQALTRVPHCNIVYLKCDDFTYELIQAIRQDKNAEFREKYRYADLLLMDDIQYVAGKRATQKEIFNILSTLYDLGKKIVLASDRPPRETFIIAEMVNWSFESGLVADIQPPDDDLRRAIIRSKAKQLGITLPDEVIEYIAAKFTSDIFQLEGAVKTIIASRDILDVDITVRSASRRLSEYNYC